MSESNGSISYKISTRLAGLIALFDLIGAGVNIKRDASLEDFAYFMIQEFEWMHEEINKIK